MWFINVIKVAAIWLCDLVNKCYDPFKQAQLPIVTADLVNLETQLFWHLQTTHVVDGQFMYQLPMPKDSGDFALFQGLYLAMLAFRYADTAAAEAQLERLFINNILIRGIQADGTINDTASNDAATGVIFGLWASKQTDLAARWARQICASGYALTDLKGTPTEFGALEQGWKADPLRITLLLAILAVGRLNDPALDAPYFELFAKYKLLLAYPKVKLLWWDTDYDTHRAAIHLHILYKVTGQEIYAKGLRRIHRIMRKSNNAWVEVLCAPALGPHEVNLSMLHTFTYQNRTRGVVQPPDPGPIETVNWGGHVRAKETLPMENRGSQEFMWQRNMFSYKEWDGVTEAYIWHSGLDFVICCGLARQEGLIK